MPVTNGHGNPKWTREETLLALDLLYRHDAPLDRRHREVIVLSELLKGASIHPPEKRRESFRNADGVALKMQNLLSAVEPGRGLSFSKADRAAVADYPKARKDELAALADLLRASFLSPSDAEDRSNDEVFFEGLPATVRHRQRDQRLRQRLLEKFRGLALRCEMCDATPPPLDRDIQESRYEAHHRIPLAQADGERETRVADMALLCACCHRMLHKMITRSGQWVSVAEGRSFLGLAP